MSNTDTIFIFCPKHKRIVNVYGDLGNETLSLNCGCDLANPQDYTKYEITKVTST